MELQSWCNDFRMVVSETKSKVLSPSDLGFWELFDLDLEYVSSLEQVDFCKYLGVNMYPTLKDIKQSKNKLIISRAWSFAKSIMSNLKYDIDKTDVILASWKNIAMPAILYGIETIPVSANTIRELGKVQSTIGKFALQVRGSTANEIVNTDLGLKPVKMVIYERKLKYFARINDKDFCGSDYVKKCLEFNKQYESKSIFLKEINSICKETQIDIKNVSKWKTWREDLSKWGAKNVVKSMESKSSLRFCSFPKTWWKKAFYVNDSEYSKIISEFRGGNARLGNRDNDLEDFAPTSFSKRIVICPACCKERLNESHVIVDCESLIDARKDCFLNDQSLYRIIESVKQSGTIEESMMSTEILRGFLDTYKDSPGTIRQKAEILDFLRCQFMSIWIS